MKILVVLILSAAITLTSYSQDDTLFVSSSFGDFSDAASISSAMGEFIFVSDIATSKIYKFNTNGHLISSYGGTGFGANALNQPVAVDASNGLDVFVCDYLNNRLVRLDYKLNFISFFDFNYYNANSEVSNKLYNPKSAAVISSGEMFILCDAGNYKAIKLKEFNDVNQYFGQVQDKIIEPVKVIRGNELDVWILDKSTNELLNYNNLGIFVKRIKLPDKLNPLSIAYAEKNIFILLEQQIYIYDLVKGAYSSTVIIPAFTSLRDINVVDKETIMVLHKNKVLKFKYKL